MTEKVSRTRSHRATGAASRGRLAELVSRNHSAEWLPAAIDNPQPPVKKGLDEGGVNIGVS
jgi:hypothetical protein